MKLTQHAHRAVSEHMSPGAIAIDATAGNGYDSVFLANHCGDQGHVFSFDIQASAIEATRLRLAEAALSERVTLINDCHATMAERAPSHAHGNVSAVMFNLGFLPGGDKRLVSKSTTTLAALDAALMLMAPGGVISIMAYRGHAGGPEEARAIAQRLTGLGDTHTTEHVTAPGDGPVLWLIRPRRPDL